MSGFEPFSSPPEIFGNTSNGIGHESVNHIFCKGCGALICGCPDAVYQGVIPRKGHPTGQLQNQDAGSLVNGHPPEGTSGSPVPGFFMHAANGCQCQKEYPPRPFKSSFAGAKKLSGHQKEQGRSGIRWGVNLRPNGRKSRNSFVSPRVVEGRGASVTGGNRSGCPQNIHNGGNNIANRSRAIMGGPAAFFINSHERRDSQKGVQDHGA